MLHQEKAQARAVGIAREGRDELPRIVFLEDIAVAGSMRLVRAQGVKAIEVGKKSTDRAGIAQASELQVDAVPLGAVIAFADRFPDVALHRRAE